MILTVESQVIILEEYEKNVVSYEEAVRSAVELASTWTGTAPPQVIMATVRTFQRAQSIGRRMGGMTRILTLLKADALVTQEDQTFLDKLARLRIRTDAYNQMLESLKGQVHPFM